MDATVVKRNRRPRAAVALGVIVGFLLAADLSYAASNWIVGLNGGTGEAQSGSVSNLTINAVASPSPTNLLYPGGTGDVVVTISNPNPFPVTITAVQLPTNTTYANGYTSSALTTTQTGCVSSTPSGVTWNFSSGTTSTHTLTSSLVVGASGASGNPLTVTLSNAAAMANSAPAACEATWFSMPALTGVSATVGGGPNTVSPATDGWTS